MCYWKSRQLQIFLWSWECETSHMDVCAIIIIVLSRIMLIILCSPNIFFFRLIFLDFYWNPVNIFKFPLILFCNSVICAICCSLMICSFLLQSKRVSCRPHALHVCWYKSSLLISSYYPWLTALKIIWVQEVCNL